LNITVPSEPSSITGEELYPVLVFIHGGGYSIGGNWWPQYDGTRLVHLSKEMKKPITFVNINYRLGLPGFLTSPELRAAGYKSNNGIRDQRVALAWIKDNIKGFGGDPNNITVAGESAGGGESYIRAREDIFTHIPQSRQAISFFQRTRSLDAWFLLAVCLLFSDRCLFQSPINLHKPLWDIWD